MFRLRYGHRYLPIHLQARREYPKTNYAIESAQSKAVEEGFCQLLVDHLGKHQDDAEELSSTDLYHCAKVLELLLLQGIILHVKIRRHTSNMSL